MTATAEALLEELVHKVGGLECEVVRLRESLAAGRARSRVSGVEAAALLGLTPYRFRKEFVETELLERIPGQRKFWRHEVLALRDRPKGGRA